MITQGSNGEQRELSEETYKIIFAASADEYNRLVRDGTPAATAHAKACDMLAENITKIGRPLE